MIDRASFFDQYSNFDKSTVVEIIDLYLHGTSEQESTQDRLDLILRDIQALDFPALRFNAHTLKSASVNFFDYDVKDAAFALEQKGKEKDGTDLLILYNKLVPLVHHLMEELSEIRKEFL